MSEIIEFNRRFSPVDHIHTPVGWALISVLAEKSADVQKQINSDKNGKYEVSLTVNGVECRFSHIIDRMSQQFDYEVNKKATQLVNDLIENKFSVINDILQNAQSAITEELSSFNNEG